MLRSARGIFQVNTSLPGARVPAGFGDRALPDYL